MTIAPLKTDLKNKTALVTGAANGLGKALATELHRLGWNLALLDIDAGGLQQLETELKTEGRTISVHCVDVSDENGIIEAKRQIEAIHPNICMLINNAGISISRPFELTEMPDFRRLFEINFWGTVYCTKHFLPALKKQSDSRVVNIISDFALFGFPGKAAYASSKSAILGFTNTLKTELAGTAVKICLVIPPPLDTGIVRNGLHVDEEKRRNEIAFLEKHGMPLPKAARLIVKQGLRGKYRVVIGSMMFWIDLASRIFPTALHNQAGKRKKKFDFI